MRFSITSLAVLGAPPIASCLADSLALLAGVFAPMTQVAAAHPAGNAAALVEAAATRTKTAGLATPASPAAAQLAKFALEARIPSITRSHRDSWPQLDRIDLSLSFPSSEICVSQSRPSSFLAPSSVLLLPPQQKQKRPPALSKARLVSFASTVPSGAFAQTILAAAASLVGSAAMALLPAVPQRQTVGSATWASQVVVLWA
ncbi:hypothetical protein NP233_g1492 [Leucocoprinus birnbaumii]|uniref:Antifreeze protein n=1 Tax=Leucocoprinus birnbaumii TaxID=56174 RepID=A0AAD5YZM1_9AGAR|nr:hypothetical protein NP233_g1492 [Leucocoprinus birnbaumii]